MKKVALVALFAALTSTAALADNTGKAYLALDLGKASYANVDLGNGQAFANPGVVNFALGYHFTPMLALEAGSTTFGDSVVDFAGLGGGAGLFTLSTQSYYVAAAGTYTATPQIDFIGKIGISSNSEKLTTTGVAAGNDYSSSKADVLFGLAAQYNFSEQYAMRVQYQNHGQFGSASDDVKAAAFTGGLVFTF